MAPERPLCALATVVTGHSRGCRAKSADGFDWDIPKGRQRYGTVLRMALLLTSDET